MGLFDALLGNASEVEVDKVEGDLRPILVSEERILKAYKLVRDMIIFTDKRVLFVDKQGMTGKKVEYLSLPYGKITAYSLETAGSFDAESELKIWVSGFGAPIQKELGRKVDVPSLARMLAEQTL
jgi:hypothetical protein